MLPSMPKDLLDGIFSKNQSKKASDPCGKLLDSYLLCVEGHERGLSEGDECKMEADVYKKCRADIKAQKAQQGAQPK